MDLPTSELMHWIPTPLLAFGFWMLMKKAFTDHEEKFKGLVERFELAMARQNEHNTALALMSQLQTSQAAELLRLRDRHHDLANHFMTMQAQIITKLMDEGSGPGMDPRRKPL